MTQIFAAIEIDGEISVGEVIKGLAHFGETVTIKLHNENGVTIELSGVVVEIIQDLGTSQIQSIDTKTGVLTKKNCQYPFAWTHLQKAEAIRVKSVEQEPAKSLVPVEVLPSLIPSATALKGMSFCVDCENPMVWWSKFIVALIIICWALGFASKGCAISPPPPTPKEQTQLCENAAKQKEEQATKKAEDTASEPTPERLHGCNDS